VPSTNFPLFFPQTAQNCHIAFHLASEKLRVEKYLALSKTMCLSNFRGSKAKHSAEGRIIRMTCNNLPDPAVHSFVLCGTSAEEGNIRIMYSNPPRPAVNSLVLLRPSAERGNIRMTYNKPPDSVVNYVKFSEDLCKTEYKSK
jgi:hypothetical protein